MVGGAALVGILLAQARPVFEARVQEVRVDVSVTKKGLPVRALQAEDFVVKDDGVPQDVELVDRSRTPTTVVLAMDRSASVSGAKLVGLRAAARGLLAGLGPRDEVVLLAFDHRIEVLQDATTDRAAIVDALDGLRTGGASAVVDAVSLALERRWGTGLPLVVLFTDGQDSASWLENDDLLSAARESSALLHVVGTEGRGLRIAPSSRGAGFAPVLDESGYVYLLRRVAEATGGSYWGVDADEDLESAFRRVVEAANQRYVLRYEPRGVPGHGVHRLQVSVRRRGVEVRARREYVRTN
jgi:VWFA-related protein